MKNKTYKNRSEHGFTLVEIMVVITIIGILAGVVLVSTQSASERSKKASAITTASSVLPELVTCQDDGGTATDRINASSGGGIICSLGSAEGHNAQWPNISKTGWSYGTTAGTINSSYLFTLTKNGETITCSYATNECTSN